MYTGQRLEAEIGLYFYNARFYDPVLGRFAQADTIIPGAGNPMALDRYAYVENNPLKYIDLDGHEKYIIIYGVYPNTNSFQAAAETQYQKALDAGYSKEDILIIKASTDDKFFDAIAGSEENEIEQIHIFSHGWGVDSDVPKGGLQLSPGDIPKNQFTSEDLGVTAEGLENRFAEGSEFHMYGCKVGRDSFSQAVANTFDTKVYAYRQKLKFWRYEETEVFAYGRAYDAGIWSPYDGGGAYQPGVQVEMFPYWLGEREFWGHKIDLTILRRHVKPEEFIPIE